MSKPTTSHFCMFCWGFTDPIRVDFVIQPCSMFLPIWFFVTWDHVSVHWHISSHFMVFCPLPLVDILVASFRGWSIPLLWVANAALHLSSGHAEEFSLPSICPLYFLLRLLGEDIVAVQASSTRERAPEKCLFGFLTALLFLT